MNKHLSLILLFAIVVSGCNQEEILRNESTNSRTFTASFAQNESRTYIEEGNLLRWTTGDLISLFDSNTLNQQYKFDGKTGDNSGTFSNVETTFGTGNDLNCHYAVYPYNSNIEITESGIITATLPAEQNYAENSFGLGANTMVAVTENTDDTFLKFQNVGGYLKLQLYGDDMTVKSITLTGNKNEKLAGAATITAVYGQDPTISMANDATNSITLDCGEGVKIGASAETATAFWIVVPPTTFENGFEVTITDVNDNGMTKSTSNEISIVRNTIKPMEAFEVKTMTKIVAVDLGLSVKWANCNIGANSPEEYGNYFAWGDIETKSDFYENNCITYGKDSGQLISYGFVDRNILKPRYDAAAMNWENNWRLPTQIEMQELVDNCTWTWITQNGVYGCLVTGTNGNSIFLPATGYRVFDQPAIYAERFGYYWTSTAYNETPNDDKSYGLSFGWDDYFQDIIYNLTGSNRSYGYTIRPVQE